MIIRFLFKRKRIAFILLSILVVLFAIVPPSVSDMPIYDNVSLHKFLAESPAFHKTHPLMAAQTDKMHAIVDSFLKGDSERIVQLSKEITQDMRTMAQSYAPPAGQEAITWKVLSEIAAHAQTVVDEIGKNDYLKAFSAYSQLTSLCLQCHQVARGWGKFPEPPPAKEPDPPADPAKTQAAPAGTTKQ